MRMLPLVFMALLAACVPQSGTLDSPELGLTGRYTEQVVISDHPRHTLVGHLIRATRDETGIRALVIGHRRDGVNRLRMYEAWSGGVALPFSSTHLRLDGCTHGHCREHAVGMILLSDDLFAHARTHGLSARLIGTGDAIDIAVPASLFQALPE